MKLEEYQKKIFLYNIGVLKSAFKNNKDFFEKIGIDESTLTLWRKDRRIPRFNTVYKICEELNISVLDMLNKKMITKIEISFEEILDKGE